MGKSERSGYLVYLTRLCHCPIKCVRAHTHTVPKSMTLPAHSIHMSAFPIYLPCTKYPEIHCKELKRTSN